MSKWLDERLEEWNEHQEFSVKLGFKVKNPDGSYSWTEKGNKVKDLTLEEIITLGGSNYLTSL